MGMTGISRRAEYTQPTGSHFLRRRMLHNNRLGMTYPSTWQGSTDHANLSGTAEFHVNGETYRMRLHSFDDYQAIQKMLDTAFQNGKDFVAHSLIDAVQVRMSDWERNQCST